MNSSLKFGLSQKTIVAINSVFSQYPGIQEVMIYGSRAKGNFREGSDIDLTIKAPTLTTSDLLKIENMIDDLMLPYKMDLSLFHQLTEPDILDHINRVGVKFFPM
jgi:predicted nucleotidyltransferase